MGYNIVLDLLLLHGRKCLFVYMFNLDITLQYRSEKKEKDKKTYGSRLTEIFALHGTGEGSFAFLGVVLVSRNFKFIIFDDL